MVVVFEILVSLLYNLSILKMAELFKNISKELSRKFAHIMIANWWFMAIIFNDVVVNITVPVIMMIIMSLSYKLNIFKSVERNKQEFSYGTIYYFISLIILIAIGYLTYGSIIKMGIFFLPLGYGDGAAALFGKYFHWHNYKIFGSTKSLSGNIAMFIVSFISILIYNYLFLRVYNIRELVIIGLVATFIEATSVKGIDNFTIPIVTYLITIVAIG
ncbi:hypothetical protein LI221_08595 [Faecalimonas umbilicata]|nr:hypothetical protein [Faecalimonas umbilicata]